MVDIKKEIKLAFLENKIAIFVSIAILFISLLLGYIFEPYLHSFFNPIVENLTNKVQSGVIQITFRDIFLNNILIVIRLFLFGIFFCFSVVILAFNGFFVGYFVGTSDDLLGVLLLTIPHGIFEFSSFILACASGIVLFNFFYRLVKNFFSQKQPSILQRLYYSVDVSYDKLKQAFILFIIASILMVIAGIVEAYITLPLAQIIMSVVG